MFDSRRGRLFVIALLLACHAAMFPLYAQQPVNPDAGVFPDETRFLDDPGAYLGQRVTADGPVTRTDPLVFEVTAYTTSRELTVTGTDRRPALGDQLRVFGTLTDSTTIRSHTVFTVPPYGHWYAWGISFIAGLWVLARLLGHWTVDLSTLAFRPRADPYAIRELPSLVGLGGEDDA